MSGRPLSPGLRIAFLAGALGLFLALDTWAMHALFTSRFPGANDFFARWLPMRAWLVEGRSPYSSSVTLETQVGMYGHPARPDQDKGLFSYPLFSVVFFGPFALIESYAWASAAWLALLQVALFALLGLSLAWAGWRPPPWLFGLTLLFGLLWYHSARTLILGQFAALEALLLVGALLAVRRGQDGWAGVLLALATVKPQMAVLLIPGLLLWAALHRRWGMAAWFGGTLALLLGGSFLALPTWLAEWRAQLGSYVDNSFIPGPVAILTAYFFPGGNPPLEYALNGMLLAGLLGCWWQARPPGRQTGGPEAGRRFDWAVAITLVVSNLAVVRTATTNYVMMIPALFLLFRAAQERWGRGGLMLIVLAQGALLVGLWLLFAVTVRGDVEQPAMYLPLPFLLLLGLGLIYRRWVRPESALSEAAHA